MLPENRVRLWFSSCPTPHQSRLHTPFFTPTQHNRRKTLFWQNYWNQHISPHTSSKAKLTEVTVMPPLSSSSSSCTIFSLPKGVVLPLPESEPDVIMSPEGVPDPMPEVSSTDSMMQQPSRAPAWPVVLLSLCPPSPRSSSVSCT